MAGNEGHRTRERLQLMIQAAAHAALDGDVARTRAQRNGEGEITAYNGSGRAPQAADASWYLERNLHAIPLTSAHAVSIPGAIDAWVTILRDHGKLGLDSLLQPAIKAAEEGYVVAPRIAFSWNN